METRNPLNGDFSTSLRDVGTPVTGTGSTTIPLSWGSHSPLQLGLEIYIVERVDSCLNQAGWALTMLWHDSKVPPGFGVLGAFETGNSGVPNLG